MQSHMNKDHADDTRAIVQHSTSVPVKSVFPSLLSLCIFAICFMSKVNV